ncbi:MAG: cytochrome P450 [Litorilinea sp.]
MSLTEMQAMQQDQLTFACQMAAELGGVAHLKILRTDLFFISEPAMTRELLLHHARQMHRDPFVAGVFKRFLGNGVFVAEGETWQRQRKLVQPAFHTMRIREYVATMADYTREMATSWEIGSIHAIHAEFTQLTLRIIAKTMYDVDLVEETAALGDRMRTIFQVAEAQLKSPFRLPQWLPTPENRRQQAALQQVRSRLNAIIEERLQNGDGSAEGSVQDRGDLLSMLLAARDEDGLPMPRAQVLDECITLFVAGHETTAAALTWVWHLLTQHPHILKEVTAEVQTVLGAAPATFETLPQLPLLEAVIKETLRLYPPAFGFGRSVIEPFQANGVDFPKDAVIIFSTYATHRRPDLWDEPDEFRPHRFLDPENQPDRYTYLPFGAGSRICLGTVFAMLEAQVILATLLQHRTLTRVDDAPVVKDTVVTLRPRDPLRMRVGAAATRVETVTPVADMDQAATPTVS